MPETPHPGVYYQEQVPQPHLENEVGQLIWVEPVKTRNDLDSIKAAQGTALIVKDENQIYVFDSGAWWKFTPAQKMDTLGGDYTHPAVVIAAGGAPKIAAVGGLTGGAGSVLDLNVGVGGAYLHANASDSLGVSDGASLHTNGVGLDISDGALKLQDPVEVIRAHPPCGDDDLHAGFVPGSKWIDTTTDTLWVCTFAQPGEAESLAVGAAPPSNIPEEMLPTKAKRLVKFGEGPQRKLSPEEE